MRRFVVVFLFVVVATLIRVEQANAQSCGGSAVCGSRTTEVCTNSSGNACDPDVDPIDCSCNYECGGSSTNISCSAYWPTAACEARGICETRVGVCLKSGACVYTPAEDPDPDPPAGWGACGSCDYCGYTASECRFNPEGACVWDPAACGPGGGGGGGGGDPCPDDTCDGYCCDYVCQTEPCIVTADCRADLVANGVQCMWTPSGKYCVNSICPNDTIPGTICGCSGGIACGDPCAGGCESGSTCRFVNAAGGFCDGSVSTYCVGDTGDGYNTYNPDLVTPNCLSGDTGNSMLQRVSSGATTGFSAADIQSTCFVAPADAWWQAIGGDVISGAGTMTSDVPAGENFILGNTAGFPGLAMSGGVLSVGEGTVSEKGWSVESVYSNYDYYYDRFVALAPESTVWNSVASIQTGGTVSGGYEWFVQTGDYTLTENLSLNGGRKVILFVSGNLTINANIRLNDPDVDYFMVVVGRNLTIDPSVTNIAYGTGGTGGGGGGTPTPTPSPSPTPPASSCNQPCTRFGGDTCGDGLVCVYLGRDNSFCADLNCVGDPDCDCSTLGATTNTYALEGVFHVDGQFSTGEGSTALGVRGSVVAGSVNLQRNLGASNDSTPAETFEFSEENMLLYPSELNAVTVAWREVAP